MKILVTGGAGFIGSNFIKYILKNYADDSIVNFDKLTYAGNLENLKDIEKDARYSFVQGDICDFNALSQASKNVDAIVHFAAESHVDRSIHSSKEFLDSNIYGTQNVIDLVRELAPTSPNPSSRGGVKFNSPFSPLILRGENNAVSPLLTVSTSLKVTLS